MPPIIPADQLLSVFGQGPGRYVGRCVEGFRGRAFGGHLLARSVCVASLATATSRLPSSLHTVFVAPALAAFELEYAGVVLKKGRSLDIAAVRAQQNGRVVAESTLSFHDGDPSLEFQAAFPDAPSPDVVAESTERPPGTNQAVRAPFEIRPLLRDAATGADSSAWVRLRGEYRGSPPGHSALLAYAVDFLITRATHDALGDSTIPAVGASLDHAMWFHRPFRIDGWLLIDSRSTTFSGSRALSTSTIFDRSGALVATAAQEALLRASPKT